MHIGNSKKLSQYFKNTKDHILYSMTDFETNTLQTSCENENLWCYHAGAKHT